MAEDAQKIYQLIIDAGGSKAGADLFKRAADQISDASAKAAGAGKVVTDSVALAEKSYASLVNRIDPVTRAQVAMAKDITDVQRAFSAQVISVDQAAASLQKITVRYEQAVARSKELGQGAGAGAGIMAKYGSVIQGAGFQVGDFAVQVASGGGVLRPFIQQGTQLLGMFGPWGAVVGAAGAAIGALVESLTSEKDAAADAGKATDAYAEALQAADDIARKLRGDVEAGIPALQAEQRYRLEGAKAAITQAQALVTAAEAQAKATQAAADYEATTNPEDTAASQQAGAALKYLQQVQDAQQKVILEQRKLAAELEFGGQSMDPFAKMGEDNSGDYYKPSSTSSSSRKTETSAIRDQRSAVSDLIRSMQTEIVLSQESTRQRSVDESVIRAQTAAQRDYDAGLRDSPLLDPATIAKIQAMAGATYDMANAQREASKYGLDRTVKSITAATDAATSSTSQWVSQVTQLGSTFSSAFDDAVIGGNKLSDVLNGLEQDLARLSIRFGEDQALKGLFGEGGLGSGGGLFGSIFSALGLGGDDLTSDPFPCVAGRASGGPVDAGTLYRVNENGREYFKPRVDGTVIPMGGGNAGGSPGVVVGGTSIIINDMRGSGDPVDVRQSNDATGRRQIEVFVRDQMKSNISTGSMDKSLGGRFGAKAVPQKRRA
jgi:hypothetical protein